jgi:hypothetical protein
VQRIRWASAGREEDDAHEIVQREERDNEEDGAIDCEAVIPSAAGLTACEGGPDRNRDEPGRRGDDEVRADLMCL